MFTCFPLQIPKRGFQPAVYDQDLTPGKLQQLVEAAVASPDQPWCWLFPGTSSGPDGMMVLQKVKWWEGKRKADGHIVLYLHSKFMAPGAQPSWDSIMHEVQMVQPTKPQLDIEAVLVINTDPQAALRLRGGRPSADDSSDDNSDDSMDDQDEDNGSDSSSSSGSCANSSGSTACWQRLVEGKAVHLPERRVWVTMGPGEVPWQVHGAAVLIHEHLQQLRRTGWDSDDEEADDGGGDDAAEDVDEDDYGSDVSDDYD